MKKKCPKYRCNIFFIDFYITNVSYKWQVTVEQIISWKWIVIFCQQRTSDPVSLWKIERTCQFTNLEKPLETTMTTDEKALALKEKSARLRRRLYPSLATWEIVLWTGCWIFGVGYSTYNVYLASKRKFNKLCHLWIKYLFWLN